MNYTSKLNNDIGNVIQPRFCFACYSACSGSCSGECKGSCMDECKDGCDNSCGGNCTDQGFYNAGP